MSGKPEPSGPDIEPDGAFLAEVEQATGEALGACFQCQKCTCGCPLAGDTDINPNRLIRLIQYGLRDEVLRSNAIWLCAGCETCAARCPNGVDIAKVMDYLRVAAITEGIEPADPKVAAFHKAFLETLDRYGRSHELDMIRRYKMKTGTYFENMALGLRMFGKGKIKLFGRKIKDIEALRRMMQEHGPRR